MTAYPRSCPRCGVMTPEDGFGLDSSKATGRKSHCRECDRERGRAYYEAHRKELYARRQAERDAAAEAYLEALEMEQRIRVAETKRLHNAQEQNQKKLLRELGVPDLTPEEVTERARRAQEIR